MLARRLTASPLAGTLTTLKTLRTSPLWSSMLPDIIFTIVLPIFTLLGIGFLIDRIFKLDVPTLSRVNFYVLSTAAVFVLTYDSTLALRGAGGAGGVHAPA